MNHRSAPFQFMSIDPAKRQAELEKRFGLSKSSDKKMHLDLGNHGFVGMRKEPNSASSSPRLQHRVPIFVEGMEEPAQSIAEANPTNVDAAQKPRVRVVPIEVETDDMTKRRARAFSGDPYSRGPRLNDTRPKDPWFDTYERKPKVEPAMTGPRVCNIPIKVERGPNNAKTTSPAKKVPVNKEPVVKTIPVQKETVPKPPQANGCNASTESSKTPDQAPPQPHEVSLKKIAVVMDKLVGYQTDVEKFSGTSKEKQYRYLDEMLTRLMLDLDNVETMGNEDVRLKRKEAIRKVQQCIDLLESKVCDNSQATPSQSIPQEIAAEQNTEVSTDTPKSTDQEMIDTEVPKLAEEDGPKPDEVEMQESEQTESAEVVGEQTMEAEVPPEVGSKLPKSEVVEIEISEVTESDANSQEEIVSEPIVKELNESSESVENCCDEALADPEIKIAQVQADSESNQSMEVDEVVGKSSVAETVTKLEVDNSDIKVCESNGIPNSESDIEMNNQIVTKDAGNEDMCESNLSQTNS